MLSSVFVLDVLRLGGCMPWALCNHWHHSKGAILIAAAVVVALLSSRIVVDCSLLNGYKVVFTFFSLAVRYWLQLAILFLLMLGLYREKITEAGNSTSRKLGLCLLIHFSYISFTSTYKAVSLFLSVLLSLSHCLSLSISLFWHLMSFYNLVQIHFGTFDRVWLNTTSRMPKRSVIYMTYFFALLQKTVWLSHL